MQRKVQRQVDALTQQKLQLFTVKIEHVIYCFSQYAPKCQQPTKEVVAKGF